jgi:hypothetical protein
MCECACCGAKLECRRPPEPYREFHSRNEVVRVSTDSPPDVSVDVDLEANHAEVRVTTTEIVEVPELFNDDGELRLWEDDAGWNGFIVEDGAYYEVNARHKDDEPFAKKRVPLDEVHTAVEGHIRDPLAGERGRFVRRCSPP